MVTLAPLPTPGDWSERILAAAKPKFNGFLDVLIPGDGGEYDPETDEYIGGTPDVKLIDNRPARAQKLGSPQEKADGNGWGTARRMRFQCEILRNDPALTVELIERGMVVRFRGGKDPSLALMTFQVLSAVNSSHAALRTIECKTEGAPVTQ